MYKIWDIFFPSRCIGCNKYEELLCKKCQQNLLPKVHIWKQNNPLTQKEKDFWKTVSYLDECIFFFPYTHKILFPKIMKEIKYRYLTIPLETIALLIKCMLLENILYKNKQSCIFVPVPLSQKRERTRGFNQSVILANMYTKNIPSISVTHLIHKKYDTPYQSMSSKNERRNQLQQKFVYKENKNIKKTDIIYLIDDIITTGSTLDACAQCLKENGHTDVRSIVLAH
jgi:ComF family protein